MANKMKKITLNYNGQYIMDRINKLVVGQQFENTTVGTVTCLNRANGIRGSRRFSVKGSPAIKNGKYSLKGIRSRIADCV